MAMLDLRLGDREPFVVELREQAPELRDVAVGIEEQAVGAQAVAAGAADLLVVGLHRARQVAVDHESDVRLDDQTPELKYHPRTVTFFDKLQR